MLTLELNENERLALLEILIDELSTARFSIGTEVEKRDAAEAEEDMIKHQLRIDQKTALMQTLADLITRMAKR